MGIPALVPFRDRIAGTHDRRSAGAGTNAAVGRGARLRRDVGGTRDRHPPRRIRARGATAYRGNTINSRWLDRLAEAAHNPTGLSPRDVEGMSACERSWVKVSTSGSSLVSYLVSSRRFSSSPPANEFATVRSTNSCFSVPQLRQRESVPT